MRAVLKYVHKKKERWDLRGMLFDLVQLEQVTTDIVLSTEECEVEKVVDHPLYIPVFNYLDKLTKDAAAAERSSSQKQSTTTGLGGLGALPRRTGAPPTGSGSSASRTPRSDESDAFARKTPPSARRPGLQHVTSLLGGRRHSSSASAAPAPPQRLSDEGMAWGAGVFALYHPFEGKKGLAISQEPYKRAVELGVLTSMGTLSSDALSRGWKHALVFTVRALNGVLVGAKESVFELGKVKSVTISDTTMEMTTKFELEAGATAGPEAIAAASLFTKKDILVEETEVFHAFMGAMAADYASTTAPSSSSSSSSCSPAAAFAATPFGSRFAAGVVSAPGLRSFVRHVIALCLITAGSSTVASRASTFMADTTSRTSFVSWSATNGAISDLRAAGEPATPNEVAEAPSASAPRAKRPRKSKSSSSTPAASAAGGGGGKPGIAPSVDRKRDRSPEEEEEEEAEEEDDGDDEDFVEGEESD
jgi:hypothetical protein